MSSVKCKLKQRTTTIHLLFGCYQFSHSVVSDSLWSHGLQYARLPCPSLNSRTCSNSCPLSWWCHPAISSSVIPFSHLQSFPESGSFPMSQFFSSMAKALELQLQHQSFKWIFRTDFLWDGLVGSPCSPRDSQESSPTPQLKASIFWCSDFVMIQLSHPYMTTGKATALTRQTFVGKVISQLFDMLSRLAIVFLPRGKCLLISWLQSPSAVILEPKKMKSHCFHCFPIYLPWSDRIRCHDLHFLNIEF